MTGQQLYNEAEEITFSEAFRLFTRLSLMVTRGRPEIAVHCILLHAMPLLEEKNVADINRRLINRLINAMVIDGKIEQSRRLFSLLKQFFAWCEFQGYIETSPLGSQSLGKVAGGLKSKPRERVLTDEEIKTFWDMWELADVDECSAWAARLVLCSARRPDEVLRARRDEFDLNNDIWNQGSRNKSNRQHSLPISPIMRECIENLFFYGGDSEWLVPSKRKTGSPVSKVFLSQAIRRILDLPYSGFSQSFQVRDLRRTARSSLSRLGVSQDVARKIMNHSLEGIDNVYNRHDYFDEMRRALDQYSDFLTQIVGDS